MMTRLPFPAALNKPMFDITEEQITDVGMTWGLTFLIGYMLFIIWKLARDSNAGRFGTFVLFFVLSFGMLGFIAKLIIQWAMGI
jgi:hypothetical protein